MAELDEKLKALLESEVPGAHTYLECVPPDKVGGILVWDGFAQLDHVARQARLWDALRRRLTEPESRAYHDPRVHA